MSDHFGRIESMLVCVRIAMSEEFVNDFDGFDYDNEGGLPALNRTLKVLSKKHKTSLIGFLLTKAIKRIGSVRLRKLLISAADYGDDHGTLFITKTSTKNSDGFAHFLGLTIDGGVVNYQTKFELKSPRVHMIKALFIAALTDTDSQMIPALVAMDEWFAMTEIQALHIESLYSKPDTWYE